MFGHYQASSSSKKKKKYEVPKKTPEQEQEEKNKREAEVTKNTAANEQIRNQGREKGYEQGRKLFEEEMPGMPEEQRRALQYEANRNIDRSYQSANRKLLGEQSRRGVVGRGGVGYAQQRDLHNLAQEAQGGVTRDVNKLNADLQAKQLANLFAMGESEAAQSGLDREAAENALRYEEEKKRQEQFENDMRGIFNRLGY